ncbi:RNA transcription, translation and transport factor protein [Babesia caballi]|uniref:RNA transcription, translation and transport factor protein n=1 Tax=Babesia caballi TaxID=5871 RepID=A0AAV4M1C5_BABCB|nr:RNA transcription, translation and transport factor protein [Babesia caballi]
MSTRERLVARKLRALGIAPPDDLERHFQTLVLKLEEEHIRHYAIEGRQALREGTRGVWEQALRAYCSDLGIDVEDELRPYTVTRVLDALTTVALEEEYMDLVGDGQLHVSTEQPAPQGRPNELESLVNKVNEILEQLDLPVLQPEASIDEVRSAVLLLLKADMQHGQADPSPTFKVLQMKLDDVPCGIRSTNPLVVKAARILRTLHSNELCKLQAEIVWLSERFQQLTANPQTNCHAK